MGVYIKGARRPVFVFAREKNRGPKNYSLFMKIFKVLKMYFMITASLASAEVEYLRIYKDRLTWF